MEIRTARRAVILAAVLALVSITASGCSVVTTFVNRTHTAIEQSIKPKVGSCWLGNFDEISGSENWAGDDPVPCSTPHETYTYAVSKLVGTFKKSWVDKDDNVDPDIDNAAYDACESEFHLNFGNDVSDLGLLYPAYFIPSPGEWASGARWVRCDIAEVTAGSMVSDPRVRALPSYDSLLADAAGNPEKYDFCVNDVSDSTNAPENEHATYAKCEASPDWTLQEYIQVPGGDSAVYPGKAALARLVATGCSDTYATPDRDTFAVIPSKTSWNDDDDRYIDCWLSS